MENSNPLISVIIPVYNGETYLAEAIESTLSQTYRPLDIIIVDDGSTDNSSRIAKTYIPHVRYQYQPNAGVGSAMSTGVELAKGEYLAFLDSDDLWVREKLIKQMTVFTQNPLVDVVFSKIEQFYSSDMLPALRKKYRYAEKIVDGYCVDTMLVKRDVFIKVGNFNPDLRTVAFIDWYTRAKDLDLSIKMVPVVMARRRIHNKNMGIWNRANQHQGYTRLIKKVLDRRRANKAAETENE